MWKRQTFLTFLCFSPRWSTRPLWLPREDIVNKSLFGEPHLSLHSRSASCQRLHPSDRTQWQELMLLLLPSDIYQGTELKFTLMRCIPEVYPFLFLQKKNPKPDAFNLCSCPCGWWFPDALIQDKACHVSKVQILPLGRFLSGHQKHRSLTAAYI